MKQYSHAWLALKAVELLKSYEGRFDEERNNCLIRFLRFISVYPGTFVRGAWFPDTVISDNIQGGHTWKYYFDPKNGKTEKRRPPSHNCCLAFVKENMDKKISVDLKMSDLPDRCEALGQMIRDAILITNKMTSGDVVVFNDSQIALLFLMLSHYICDAHVPMHCDNRDFYDPSKVHPDLEDFWEDEIKKYYSRSEKNQQFDLDEESNLQRNEKLKDYEGSMLKKCDQILMQIKWDESGESKGHWSAFLGKGNNNFWDYLVSVCLVSFHMSQLMFPPDSGVDYQKIRIMESPPFRENVEKYSPYILADAVSSVAMLWLAAWERWELLAKGIK
jgi:hypothetical protein